MGAGETVVRIASVAVPSNALAGAYPVTFRFADRDDPAIVAQCEVLLEVLPKASLDLELTGKPRVGHRGAALLGIVLRAQRGNVNARFDLAITAPSTSRWRCRGSTSSRNASWPGARTS